MDCALEFPGTLRAESGFDAFGYGQLSTASTALSGVMEFESGFLDLVGCLIPDAGERAIEQPNGDAIAVECALGGGANCAAIGVENTDILVIGGVIRASKNADEEDALVGVVAILFLAHLEGVVGLGAVICGPFGGNFDGERGVTGGDEGGADHVVALGVMDRTPL